MNFAPRGPNESDPPDLLRFKVTPGAILILLQNRKLISGCLYPLEFELMLLFQYHVTNNTLDFL